MMFLLSYFIPIFLVFNWEKVILERFLFVIATTTLIFFLILWNRYKLFKDIYRVKELIFCDGKIIGSHTSDNRGRKHFAEIEVEMNTSKYRFVTKESRIARFKKGAKTPVLLDIKNPQSSIALELHPYLLYRNK